MPVYQPLIPTGTVNLDVDYLNLQGNFQQANIVYGTDHYPFDNATPNQGFHNLVTTPPVVNSPPDGLPPATAANPRFYAYQQYSAFGVLQWSRGPSNAVPTPLTSIHGGPISIASTGRANIIDFSGMTRVMCILSGFNDVTGPPKNPFSGFIGFSQGTFTNLQNGSPGSLSSGWTGTVLQLVNNTTNTVGNVYWTLTFIRIE